MAWSRDLAYSSRRINTFFHPKTLHALYSAPIFLAIATTAPHRRHPHLPRTNSATTSYTSALALSGAEVLRVAYEPSRTSSCKITCRSAPFQIWWWWSERGILTLYKKKPLEEPRVKW